MPACRARGGEGGCAALQGGNQGLACFRALKLG